MRIDKWENYIKETKELISSSTSDVERNNLKQRQRELEDLRDKKPTGKNNYNREELIKWRS